MNAAIRRAAGAFASCATRASSATPASVARWSRAMVAVPHAGASGSMTGTASARPAPESARVGVFSAAETPACEIPEVGWFPGAARGGAPAGEMFSLMAVPKRKVSPSRRKRRHQFKRIEFISDVHRCKDCGKAKRPHVYCEQCSTNIYDDLKRGGDVGGGASR